MRWAALALATSVAGCKVSATFTCDLSSQCGAGGTCEPNGLCAFPDGGCTSGFRYGDYSGDLSGTCVGDEPTVDADPSVADAGCTAWQSIFFDPCAIPYDPTMLQLGTGSYSIFDTTTGTFVVGGAVVTSVVVNQPLGGQARVISVGGLDLDDFAMFEVVGSLPLIIASWGDATIGGLVNVGSHNGAASGPGAADPGCTGGQGGGGIASGGSGGGGGGGGSGTGGAGGRADSPNNVLGGPGGAFEPPLGLRAGCSGGASGLAGPAAMAPSNASTFTPGGAGGGALLVSTAGSITVESTAAITAGGAGGDGNPMGSACGGGGGGAGGMIALEASGTITTAGIVAANGGGGGGGGSYTENGGAGHDGFASDAPTLGGSMVTCAAGGGNGSGNGILDGVSVSTYPQCGGGGGGGAAGWIVIVTPSWTDLGAIFSPLAITP